MSCWHQVCHPAAEAFLQPVQGRNVVLESKYGSPKIVNDGVTVAKEVELEDPVENIGAKLVRQVSIACTQSVCYMAASASEQINAVGCSRLQFDRLRSD